MKTLPSASSPLESPMDYSTRLPSSAISEHSTINSPQAIEDWLTSLAEDSRASRSPQPGSSDEETTSGICGPPQEIAFASYSQDSRSWKTFHRSKHAKGSLWSYWRHCKLAFLATVHRARGTGEVSYVASSRLRGEHTSDEYSETWPSSGTMRAGACYLRPTLEPSTSESGCGSGPNWPTPRASCSRSQGEARENAYLGGVGGLDYTLSTVVIAEERRSLIPTPSAQSYGSNRGGAAGRVGPERHSLESMASRGLWPTPTAGDAKASGSAGDSTESGRHSGTTLTDAVDRGFLASGRDGANSSQRRAERNTARARYSTPNTNGNDGGSNSRRAAKARGDYIDGRLNPDWVENFLMGWPAGWSSLEPLESAELPDFADGEPDIPRTTEVTTNRSKRLKAIGNGQVPQCAAEAWRQLA